MRKHWTWFIAGLVLLGLLCGPGMAGAAETAIEVKVTNNYAGWGETIQPDYPDLSSMIGEGLTQDDFTISYRIDSNTNTIDPVTGAVTINATSSRYANVVFITYTPVKTGVGKKSVFMTKVWCGPPLKKIELDKTEMVMGQSEGTRKIRIELNHSEDSDLPVPKLVSYDADVIEAVMPTDFGYGSSIGWLKITPKGIGETTVRLVGYNGVEAQIHVKVMRDPIKLSLSQKDYICFVDEEIPLGVDLGGNDCAPNVNFSISSDNNWSGRVLRKEDDWYFSATETGHCTITATTYNGLYAQATAWVYDKEPAVRLEADADAVRMGERVEILAYSADGRKLSIRRYAVTKGEDLAHIEGAMLVPTGIGEVEVTCYNEDGSTCAATFTVEPRPTSMTLNATELTMEIGDVFEVEATFDQGSYPLEFSVNPPRTPVNQWLEPIKMRSNTIFAQAPGTQEVIVRGNRLVGTITVTVADSDKAVQIVCPEKPIPVGTSYQFYVSDRAGRIYPASFTCSCYKDTGNITPGGYFTALSEHTFEIHAKLDDGRELIASVQSRKEPRWLYGEALVIRESNTKHSITLKSDVGEIISDKLTFDVADINVLEIVSGYVKPKKTGKTTVTARSIYDPSVSTTFTIEIIGDQSDIYIGTTRIDIPAGSERPLPVVYDGNGKEVAMVWQITHQDPGEGNPGSTAFAIEDGMISCSWPTGSGELTGTVKNGSKKVKVSVYGYLLPEIIRLEPLQVWLEIGQSQELHLVAEDDTGRWGVVYWETADSGIVTVSPYTEGSKNTIAAVAAGETLLGAMLENGAIAMCVVNVYDPNARLPGDVNEDGRVDAQDALKVLQYCAGWPVKLNGWQGDVNADGSTNLQDAILLFEHDAGLDVELKQYLPPD
ncbi:MAG: dockerin type I repeat-containing protein [Clostridiales bacterium]|nr:dockerin type I repeat-containing protein [Clostridiales bacterium]